MEYLDFEVAIDAGAGGGYRVTVIDSPAGQAQELTRLPFDDAALQARLAALGESLVRGRGTRDVVPVATDTDAALRAAREFGGALFETLFVGDVRNLLIQSQWQAARQSEKGLRVRLRTPVAELAGLPWEFMYDRRLDSFVCLSSTNPFVRFLDVQQPSAPLAVKTRLNILGVVASPTGLPPLDVAAEKARVEEAIAGPRRAGLVDIVWLEGQGWRALKDAIGTDKGPWHIFHFIGHGGVSSAGEGFLALTSDQGTRYDLSASSLCELLANHRSFRLAVLNACESARITGGDLFSSTAATLVRRGLPAVVSMQREISDKAAIEFAREFYRTLANGEPVDAAVAEARMSMSLALPGSLEWATPMLHMRSPDGILFRVTPKPQSPQPEPKAEPPHPPPSEPEATTPGRVEQVRRWWVTRGKAVRSAAAAVPLVAVLALVWALWPTNPVQARIAFEIGADSVLPGLSTGLRVWALDSANKQIGPAQGLRWSSSDTTVATVTSSPPGSEAQVTGRAPGVARITAAGAPSLTAEARITVLVPVASVTVKPQKTDVQVGSTVQLNATVHDAKGGFLQGRMVRWVSSNDTVATVSAAGLVTAYQAGTAMVTAKVENQAGKAMIIASKSQTQLAAKAPVCVTEIVQHFPDPIVALAASYNVDDQFRVVLAATVKGVVYEVFYHADGGNHAQQATNPNPIWTDPSGGGIVSIAGFYSIDDMYRHLLVATKDGRVRDYAYNPNKPHSETVLGQYTGVVSIAGFYNADDHYRVLLVATQDGKVREVYYQPSPPPGRPPRGEDVLIDYGAGNVVRIAGTFVRATGDRRLVAVMKDGSVQQVLYNPAHGIQPGSMYGGSDVVNGAVSAGTLYAVTKAGGLLRFGAANAPRPMCGGQTGNVFAADNLAMDYFDEGNLVYSTNDGALRRFITAAMDPN